MPSPFPGMDPYLETPLLWPDVHHELISQIRAALNVQLRPHYVARVELRVYVSHDGDPGREAIILDVRIAAVSGKPRRGKRKTASAIAVAEPLPLPSLLDEEIEEARIEIRHLESGSLVTVIEVLSPTNKIAGAEGRASFMEKRSEVLRSGTHWVEIDLLRAGARSASNLEASDYRVIVSRRVNGHRQGCYWPIGLRQPLPVIGIPLRGDDPDAPLDLGAVLKSAYENGAYDVSIDYRQPPDPPLDDEDANWAAELVRRWRKH